MTRRVRRSRIFNVAEVGKRRKRQRTEALAENVADALVAE